MKKLILIFLLFSSVVFGQSQLIHPSCWHAALSANATNTTFTVSTTDGDLIDDIRRAMPGDSVRMLIYNPGTIDDTSPSFEPILINSDHSSGVFTVAAMTNETEYTTAKSAAVSFNLVPDGDMEWYGTGAWSLNDVAYKFSISNSGVQCLRTENNSGSSSNASLALTLSNGESYQLSSFGKKVISNQIEIQVDKGAGSDWYNLPTSSSTSWFFTNGSFVTTGSSFVLYLQNRTASGGIVDFDNVNLIHQALDNGGFEVTGSELLVNQVDRDFSGASNWANIDMATYDETGDLTVTSDATDQQCQLDNTLGGYDLTVGKYYTWQSTASALSGDNFAWRFASGQHVDIIADGSNTFHFEFTTVGSSLRLTAYGTGGITLDDISIKEIEGWRTSNATLDLDDGNERSGTYAGKVTASAANGYVYQTIAGLEVGQYYTFKGYAKATSGDTLQFRIGEPTDRDVYYISDYVVSTSYVVKGTTFKAVDDSLVVDGICKNNGDIGYFDDWSLIPLVKIDASTSSPAAQEWSIDLPLISR